MIMLTLCPSLEILTGGGPGTFRECQFDQIKGSLWTEILAPLLIQLGLIIIKFTIQNLQIS